MPKIVTHIIRPSVPTSSDLLFFSSKTVICVNDIPNNLRESTLRDIFVAKESYLPE